MAIIQFFARFANGYMANPDGNPARAVWLHMMSLGAIQVLRKASLWKFNTPHPALHYVAVVIEDHCERVRMGNGNGRMVRNFLC